MTNKETTGREAFELHAATRLLDLPKQPNGNYASVVTQEAWEAWQAASCRSNEKPLPDDWHIGVPPFPWDQEWFIAETIYGDRVVLLALPEGYSYDYKTADDTHIMKDKIKRWMQFSDSEYNPYPGITTHPTTEKKEADNE